MNINVDLKLDRAAIDQMIRSPHGMVGQGMRRAGQIVVRRAQQSAPVKTGRYRNSIRVGNFTQGPHGPFCEIVSDVPYARSIEYRQFPVLRDALAQLRPSDFTP